MKHMLRIAALAVALVSAMPAATAFVNPDVVKGTSLFEGYGASTHIGSRRLFAWTNEMRRESDLDAFVEANGGAVMRINAERTNAYVGGFDSGTDREVAAPTGGRTDWLVTRWLPVPPNGQPSVTHEGVCPTG